MHAPPLEKPLAGCRLLIVEDNFFVAQAVSDAVEGAGGEVLGPFATVVDALENLTDMTAIDGAILDIGLTEEDSYPLAAALQTTHIPFMFLTAVEKSRLPERFASSPHMAKPFTDAGLVDMLIGIGIRRK